MTALECLTCSLASLASRRMSIRDGAILATLARFNGATRDQISKITGISMPIDAMKTLVEKRLVRVQIVPSKPNRHFVTDEGADFIAKMLGKEVAK